MLSELGQDVMNWVFEGLIVGFGGQHVKEESKELKDKIGENGHASEDEQAPLIFQTSALIHEEVLDTKTLESPGSVVLTSSANISLHSNEPEVGVLHPLTFGKEMTALQVEGSKEEIASDLKLPMLMGNINHSAASINIYDPPAEVNECKKENDELGEEHKTISYNALVGESGRKELYMFYEAKSTANPSILKSFSPRATLLNSNKYSSLMRNTALKGAESSAQVSLHSAEYVKGKEPVASYKESVPHNRRDSGKGIPRDSKIKQLLKKNYKISPQFPQPNGMHVTEKSHPSEQLSAYNRLLKDGRLTECVQLLEHMERRGLLDMNKVYHVRFFETCKRQKAVREAFHYTKLIPNPTLSTFNMLMSVYASSQDSEGAFQVLQLVQDAGLKVDCKLYTTLISTCAKSGKVDAMFEVFHKMVNAGVEPNVHTYGALIDGCARAGQVAKAFGAYGIMRSK